MLHSLFQMSPRLCSSAQVDGSGGAEEPLASIEDVVQGENVMSINEYLSLKTLGVSELSLHNVRRLDARSAK